MVKILRDLAEEVKTQVAEDDNITAHEMEDGLMVATLRSILKCGSLVEALLLAEVGLSTADYDFERWHS